jgi:hypothetical protein
MLARAPRMAPRAPWTQASSSYLTAVLPFAIAHGRCPTRASTVTIRTPPRRPTRPRLREQTLERTQGRMHPASMHRPSKATTRASLSAARPCAEMTGAAARAARAPADTPASSPGRARKTQVGCAAPSPADRRLRVAIAVASPPASRCLPAPLAPRSARVAANPARHRRTSASTIRPYA